MKPQLDIERELRRFDKATLIRWILDRSIMALFPEYEIGRLKRLAAEIRMEHAQGLMEDAMHRMHAVMHDWSARAQARYIEASDDYDKAMKAWDRAMREAYPRNQEVDRDVR